MKTCSPKMVARLAMATVVAAGPLALAASPATASPTVAAIVPVAPTDTRIHYHIYSTFGACNSARLDLESSGKFYDGYCVKHLPTYWSLYITRRDAGGGGGGGSWSQPA